MCKYSIEDRSCPLAKPGSRCNQGYHLKGNMLRPGTGDKEKKKILKNEGKGRKEENGEKNKPATKKVESDIRYFLGLVIKTGQTLMSLLE